MIAMQYSFTLPSDYDMDIIDRRIRDKGPLLDGFPRLRFKAYLAARKQDEGFASSENLYAPFYLWDAPEGIDDFLSGPGFAAVSGDFGWPSVQTWMVWHSDIAANIGTAKFATRTIRAVPPHSDLAALRAASIAKAKSASKAGALVAFTGFDPTGWRQVKFCLWPRLPEFTAGVDAGQTYTVGHVSLPASS
ncbi:DUF4865 family protein [Thalassospira sp. TSL5-1]|uniref:DUF4865 family protein n=1 Tax=Thalassospira sp. TSL5-1 TaxID=1544451 RepID=UPI00093D547F|nr:DUF4865 family protein [Thalassospira sp. TSL5-1]OKH87927.1 D-amino acid aminotransferase [Thalassospira sp. TSL5-1]